ncbi:bifunctional diaminohydroxyphosphoribosylaminopyrimidine deaminase/5-amino-6-(5-phosphoribosylamino)uracil reductase [Parafrigoribacterium mesophilum]|uniref:dihydrofolate reductase family protein n=1 Tax=Parafrigoribacterium mesophilum TaxID=433646 RepID=UPI0031FD0A5B
MSLTRIFPVASGATAAESVDLQSPDARGRLAQWYTPPRRQWLRLNFVTTIAGNAAGPDGTSDALSSRTDRAVLGVIRRLSDVVLVGASSVRAEGYLLPRTAPLAVITASGNLTGHRIPTHIQAGRLLVICAQAAAEAVRSELPSTVEVIAVPAEAGVIPVTAAIRALRDRGLANIVCEGGPTLAAQLVNAELVDELCLTTSPMLDEMRLPLLSGAIEGGRLSLAQLLVDDSDALYARWMFPERSATV